VFLDDDPQLCTELAGGQNQASDLMLTVNSLVVRVQMMSTIKKINLWNPRVLQDRV